MKTTRPKRQKLLLLTSIAAPLFAYLAALTTTVHADPINLPSTILGSWCYKQGTETRQTYVRNAGVCLGTLGDVGIFIVWPDGYGSAVATCTITKVEQLAMNFYSVNSNCKAGANTMATLGLAGRAVRAGRSLETPPRRFLQYQK